MKKVYIYFDHPLWKWAARLSFPALPRHYLKTISFPSSDDCEASNNTLCTLQHPKLHYTALIHLPTLRGLWQMDALINKRHFKQISRLSGSDRRWAVVTKSIANFCSLLFCVQGCLFKVAWYWGDPIRVCAVTRNKRDMDKWTKKTGGSNKYPCGNKINAFLSTLYLSVNFCSSCQQVEFIYDSDPGI